MSDLPFTCSCGRKYDEHTWKELPLAGTGYMCFEEDLDGPEQHMEHRNCPCGTTKAIEVAAGHDNCSLEWFDKKVRELNHG